MWSRTAFTNFGSRPSGKNARATSTNSLITTFGVMWLLGYTLNTMTLLGMTLAVGVVIDDAIVVLENIERHREEGAPADQAAIIAFLNDLTIFLPAEEE